MHTISRPTRPVHALRRAWLAALAAGALQAHAQVAPPETAPAQASAFSLKQAFDAAWSRQPEALALPSRREAARAGQQAAQAWTPGPPAFEVSHKSDRLTRNDGARELEVGVAVPLWLPGERKGSGALADAEAAAVESRVGAARLRLAATVREAWWNWQRAGIDVEIAGTQLASARRLASDVARRTQAGELARADRHQADGAVAAAEAGVAHAEATAVAALQQVKALIGAPLVSPLAAGSVAEAEAEPVPVDAQAHPTLAELQDRAAVAERIATLASAQSRAHPELTLSTTRERGTMGERYGQTLTLAVRIPWGAGPRHDAQVAAARAEAAEAQAQLDLDRARLQSERDAAMARVDAARAQLAASERRATLARETRGFFEQSFRLGETDLPTRLRIEADASEAERQSARSRIELAAAISAWRQALGLLPQ